MSAEGRLMGKLKHSSEPLAGLDIKTLFLVWGPPHGTRRSELMGQQLGMEVRRIWFTTKRGKYIAPFKYLVQALMTLVLLLRHRYRLIFVQTPPILAALPVYLYSLFFRSCFVIDAHTEALTAPWWSWSLPLHRFLSRRAITTIVTNDHLKSIVSSWGAHGFVLPDVPLIPTIGHQVRPVEAPFNVAVISTASYDEPISRVLEAASRLPEVGFHITGNHVHRQDSDKNVPPNVHFTGYVPDDEYYRLLGAAQVIMCLTTDDHTLQSGASEALWLGKPIITSDWPALRDYFDNGAIHVDNTAGSIYRAVVAMKQDLPTFEAGIRALQEERRQEWQENVRALVRLIEQARP